MTDLLARAIFSLIGGRWVINRWLVPSLLVTWALTAAAVCCADEPPAQTKSAFSLRVENDAFGGTDTNYTNGISMAFTRKGGGLLGGVWNMFGEAEGSALRPTN